MIDLQQDMRDVLQMLVAAVAKFAKAKRAPVVGVKIEYDPGEGANVELSFDSSPSFEFDAAARGDVFGRLDRPNWSEAYAQLHDEAIEVVLPDGTMRSIARGTSDEDYVSLFGPVLAAELRAAKASGVFAALPMADTCTFWIESTEGFFSEVVAAPGSPAEPT
jgi:hypothetical protein